jgi:hypothetical protein
MGQELTILGHSGMTTPSFSTDGPAESFAHVTMIEGGVYVFSFVNSSHTSVDDFVALLTRIHIENKRTPLLRIVIDGRDQTGTGRSTLPSLGYLMQQIRKMIAKLPIRAPSRIAMVIDGPYVNALDMMVRMLRTKDVVRMFKPVQFVDAVKWVLEDGT